MRWPCLALLLLLCMGGAVAEEAPWPDGAFNPYERTPIRLFLDGSNLTEKTGGSAAEVMAAARYWEEGGNGALHWSPAFLQVERRDEADVVVAFVEMSVIHCGNGQYGAGCGGFGGPAYATRQGQVWLALRLPEARPGGENGYVPYASLRRTAMHELGHALGLPHSSVQGDVMFPTGEAIDPRAESPDSGPWRQKAVMALAGFGVVAGGVLAVQYAWHEWRPAARADRARSTEPLVQIRPAETGTRREYPASPTGSHQFELRPLRRGGTTEDWTVCTRCRLPRRL